MTNLYIIAILEVICVSSVVEGMGSDPYYPQGIS